MLEPRILLTTQHYIDAAKKFKLDIKISSEIWEVTIRIVQPWYYWLIPYPVIAKRRNNFFRHIQLLKQIGISV